MLQFANRAQSNLSDFEIFFRQIVLFREIAEIHVIKKSVKAQQKKREDI